jgi:hypothetical protein
MNMIAGKLNFYIFIAGDSNARQMLMSTAALQSMADVNNTQKRRMK